MNIALGSDHAGFSVKEELKKYLIRQGHHLVDVGCYDTQATDYPDYAAQVARKVSCGQCTRGILVCGTGIGMGIVANKFRGVRAAVSWNPITARLAAAHNRANVLCLSGRFFRSPQVKHMVQAWLSTPFDGGRHLRRIKKISQIELEPKRRGKGC